MWPNPSVGPAGPVRLEQLHWIIGQANLRYLQAAGPDLVPRLLAGPETIVVRESPTSRIPDRGVPMDLFASYDEFARLIRADAITPGVRVVAYDPESSAATPGPEKHDPLHYLPLFARTARSHGYRVVLAPGRDLTLTPGGRCARQRGERVGEAYLRCGIPATAELADVFVIQAAPVELDLPQLQHLVAEGARQARAANPSVVVIATLSTAPARVLADPVAIAGAARTMLAYVQGFMLNLTEATAPAAVAFLRALSSGSD